MESMMFVFPLYSFLIFGSVASNDLTINSGKFLIPSNNVMDDRIVGGYEVTIEDYPHQVSIVMNQSQMCGGFIVSENYIVTAAHCVQYTSDVLVRAGSSWRTNGTAIPLAEIMVHPEYNNPSYDNDIAVMKTVNPIVFSDVIQPIALPPKGRPMKSNSKVAISGWGRTASNSPTTPEHLRAVNIPVVDHTLCTVAYMMLVTDSQWCAGHFINGGKAPCMGDSGGAAVQKGMAVGVVAFSHSCALRAAPTVFTDVAAPAIRDFITKYTGL